MVTALQPRAKSGQVSQLHPERGLAVNADPVSGRLMARLQVVQNPTEKLLLNPLDVVACNPEADAPFLIAQNALQRDDGLTVAIIGEPGVAAGDTNDGIRRVSASELLALYQHHGKDFLKMLRGSWAVVVVDPLQGRILLASDRMGRQPLYYRVSDGHVLVGDSMGSLRDAFGKALPDNQALYHYIYFHMVPAPVAAIEGFRKLEMAQALELGPDGEHVTRYWTPEFTETPPAPLSTAHKELKTLLRAAVQRCVGNDHTDGHNRNKKTGAFLSGGLDSSTVAGMLSEISGGSADAYVIGFDAEGYDEMPYARLAARHFGIRLHEHYVTPDDVVQALPKIAAAIDEPFGNSSILPAYFCARMAAHDGVDVLLAGDGGDELFAGNERYAGQKIFENYRKAPLWLRSGLVEPLVRMLPAGLPLSGKGRSFLRQANTLLPERLQYYSFLEQNRPSDVFATDFLEGVDQSRPLQLLNGIYHRPENASVLNRMLYLDWQITLADNDLRKVNQACAMAGVKVCYPMLDDELVEFSTRIPSSWKLPGHTAKGSKLRHFYKQSLTGWLPDDTIKKSKHGFGLPFGVWMKSHKPLQELAYENILRLKARRIFLPDFLDKAVASHRDGHAAYYGEMIWVLMCLELWLAANHPHYQCEHTL